MGRLVIGIDPGLKGAIAVMRGEVVAVVDIPTIERQVGYRRNKNGKRVPKVTTSIDAVRLARLVGEMVDVCEPQRESVAFVERATASQQMGVSSAFHYGEGFGVVRGVLAHLGVPVRMVMPAKWKRDMGLVTKGSREFGRNEARDKTPAIELARKLYPGLHGELNLAKHDGRAEALLIAHWGCEQTAGTEEARGKWSWLKREA